MPLDPITGALAGQLLGGLFGGGGGDGGASKLTQAQIDLMNKMWQYQEPLAQSAVRQNAAMQPIYRQMAGQLGYLYGMQPGTQTQLPMFTQAQSPAQGQDWADSDSFWDRLLGGFKNAVNPQDEAAPSMSPWEIKANADAQYAAEVEKANNLEAAGTPWWGENKPWATRDAYLAQRKADIYSDFGVTEADLLQQISDNTVTVPGQDELPSWMQVPDVDEIIGKLRSSSDVDLARLQQQLTAQTKGAMQGRGLGAGTVSTTGAAMQGNVPLWMTQERAKQNAGLATTGYGMRQQNNQYLNNLATNMTNQLQGYQGQMMPMIDTSSMVNAYGNMANNAWNQAYQTNMANQQAYGGIGGIIGNWWQGQQNKSQAANAAGNSSMGNYMSETGPYWGAGLAPGAAQGGYGLTMNYNSQPTQLPFAQWYK